MARMTKSVHGEEAMAGPAQQAIDDGNHGDAYAGAALQAIDDLHDTANCAKKKLQILLTQEEKRRASLANKLDEETKRADRFQKLYEHERANIKTLQHRVTELDRLLKQVCREKGETSPRLYKGAPATDQAMDQEVRQICQDYVDIYDNWWKHAFLCLTTEHKMEEKSAILYLLDILKRAYGMCAQTSVSQVDVLKAVTMFPTRVADNNGYVSPRSDPTAGQFAAIFDTRKQYGDISVEDIKMKFTKTPSPYTDPPIQAYSEHVIEVCWRMCLQNPMVTIDTGITEGDPLDTSKYTLHNKRPGRKIDCIVWPAIHLCKGGALLWKGVAKAK